MGKRHFGWLNWFSRIGTQGRSSPGDDVREFAATVAIEPPEAWQERRASPPPPIQDSHNWADEGAASDIMDSRPLHGPPRDFAVVALEITGPGKTVGSTEGDALVQAQPTLGQVGRYQLKTPLGQGGMGQVHEAWDPLLSRTVAVKTLQFELPQPLRESLDGMILNEARAAAGLSHAYIVTVFDAGLSKHGVYIAMERLRGRDLRHALSTGWLPSPRLAAVLVRRVADALAYAHGRGVVHCDIKPANIFLVGRDRPKVLDFGIARIAHETAVPALDSALAGSPYYQAPEQVRGEAVDSRTDLYALGTVLYELLTGRRAFGGDSVEQIQNAVLNSTPPLAHELRPDVPVELSEIAARAMSREPRDRPISAIEMSMMLRHWAESHAAKRSLAKGAADAVDARPAAPERGRQPFAGGPAASARAALGIGAATPNIASSADTADTAKRRWLQLSWLAGAMAVAGLLVALVVVIRPADTDTQPADALADGAQSPGQTAGNSPAGTDVARPGATADKNANTNGNLNDGSEVAATGTPSPADPGAQPSSAATAAGANASNEPAMQSAAAPARPPRTQPRTTPAAPAAAAPLAVGSVQLAISPWGRVEVNGSLAGTTPPLTRLSLPEGRHTITVRNADFPPFVVTVVVDADRPATVRHRFGP